jgi:ATP-dependent DNA helicase RecG
MTIKRHLAKMPNIRYVGSGYSGHWEVLDKE